MRVYCPLADLMTSNIRRSTMSLRINFSGFLRSQSGLKPKSDLGLAAFSSLATIQRTAIANSVRREMVLVNGIRAPSGREFGRDCMVRSRSLFEHVEKRTLSNTNPYFARYFASKASKKDGETPSEARKDVSTVEDPFDAPTYNIPEKPVTFTEGASYSVIILAGLGVAAAAGYAVFKELIFEPKEYKIFNKALKRVQDDSQVRVRIGSPITGYGQESRNRAARQRISNKVFTDEDGVEHVQISFYIRGPHGAGKVFAEMFKDKVDKEWKYTYLIVQFMQPSQTQLILESYMPAPAQVAA